MTHSIKDYLIKSSPEVFRNYTYVESKKQTQLKNAKSKKKLILRVVDTPGYGQALDLEQWGKMIKKDLSKRILEYECEKQRIESDDELS